MKKSISIFMAVLLIMAAVVGCSTEKEKTNATNEEKESIQVKDTDKVYKIGICQLIEHPALDAAYDGFVDGLAEAGYIDGVNIEIDKNSAQGDQSNAVTISNKLVNNNSDLILAIATPAAQAAANATKEIPVLITAVTDPAVVGIVESNEAPGGNVTGTSDLTPVKEQIELLKELFPEAEKVAILYCSSELNSEIQAEIAMKAAAELGITAQKVTVSSTNEIQQVVQSLVGKVDVIYTPTDNVIADGMETVSLVATRNGIPIICGEDGNIERGALATRGINYYDLGKQTAAMAVQILEGKAEPATMPIEYSNKVAFSYNENIAKELGITIPDSLLKELE
jgi:ABC-type uncharacterized transport system, periplasmic component